MWCYPRQIRAEGYIYLTGVLINIPAGQQVGPGDFATYVLEVENPTKDPKALNVTASSSRGWLILGNNTYLNLKPGDREVLVLSVMVPGATTAGSEDILSITLTSEGETAECSVKTRVKEIHKVLFDIPERYRGQSGEDVRIPITLTNRGSLPEEIDYRVSSEPGWSVRSEDTYISLAPGESVTTEIICTIPETSPLGSTKLIRVIFHMSDNRTETYEITVFVKESSIKQEVSDSLDIPLQSYFNLSLMTPEDNVIPWQTAFRLGGKVNPRLKFDLYFSGEQNTDGLLLPSAMFLGVTGKKWLLRTGGFDSNWDGLISAPTSTNILYFQDERKLPWKIWVGSPDSLSLTPTWWGGNIEIPGEDLLGFYYLHTDNSEAYFSDSIELFYSPQTDFISPYSTCTLRGAIGNGQNLLWQGEASLFYLGDVIDLNGVLKGGFEFYKNPKKNTDTEKFSEITFSAAYHFNDVYSLEPGIKFRQENDLLDKATNLSTYWIRINIREEDYLYLQHYDGVSGSTEKVELGLSGIINNKKVTTDFSWDSSHNFIFYAKCYEQTSPSDNVESYFTLKRLVLGNGDLIQPGFGVKWNRRINEKWTKEGAIQINFPLEKEVLYSHFLSNLRYWVGPSTSLQFSGKFQWGLDCSRLKIGLFLQHQDIFKVPVPWGALKGTVYYDLNGNGVYEPREPGVPGISVFVDGERKAESDADGLYTVSRLKSGPHLVEIGPDPTDGYLREKKWTVTVKSNHKTGLDIPVHRPLEIKGLLFIDKDKDNEYDSEEKSVSGVSVGLYEKDDIKPIAETVSGNDGVFFFTKLLPGKYLIKLNPETLPEDILIPEPLSLILKSDITTVNLPLHPKEKEIEFTFMEPLN